MFWAILGLVLSLGATAFYAYVGMPVMTGICVAFAITNALCIRAFWRWR